MHVCVCFSYSVPTFRPTLGQRLLSRFWRNGRRCFRQQRAQRATGGSRGFGMLLINFPFHGVFLGLGPWGFLLLFEKHFLSSVFSFFFFFFFCGVAFLQTRERTRLGKMLPSVYQSCFSDGHAASTASFSVHLHRLPVTFPLFSATYRFPCDAGEWM